MDDAPKPMQQNGVWDERRLRVATEAGGVALWSWNVDSDRITMDDRAFEIWGLPVRDEITFEELSACVVPADLDKVKEAFNATRDLSGAYEIDFQIQHGDEVRWVSASGRGDDQGIIDRIMYGVFLDVSGRKRAEENWEIVTHEMHHRIKNLFSLSSALATIAARNTTTKEEMHADITLRLRGLAGAHDLIVPGSHSTKQSIQLQDLLTVLLSPYLADNALSADVSILATGIMVGGNAINSIAMLVHELATNSAKYGALTSTTGRIILSARDDGEMVKLIWDESGGPKPDASAHTPGFGRQMKDRIIRQLRGSITRDWTDAGVVVTMRLNKAILSA